MNQGFRMGDCARVCRYAGRRVWKVVVDGIEEQEDEEADGDLQDGDDVLGERRAFYGESKIGVGILVRGL